MSRHKPLRPTDAELSILRVLWLKGACTVREVQDELNRQRPTGYTTVLKFLQIMTEKGLVTRDESKRSHVYSSKDSEDHTQRHLVRDLIDRAFGGSTAKLILQAVAVSDLKAEELNEIRRLLEVTAEAQAVS